MVAAYTCRVIGLIFKLYDQSSLIQVLISFLRQKRRSRTIVERLLKTHCPTRALGHVHHPGRNPIMPISVFKPAEFSIEPAMINIDEKQAQAALQGNHSIPPHPLAHAEVADVFPEIDKVTKVVLKDPGITGAIIKTITPPVWAEAGNFVTQRSDHVARPEQHHQHHQRFTAQTAYNDGLSRRKTRELLDLYQ